MIIKNEAAVLKRCLESVLPFISCWVICDTGSTDSSEELVRSVLHGIPGEWHRDPWVNFGHNRTLSLNRARGKADYHLLLDADMVLNVPERLPELVADGYWIRFAGWCDYSVLRLVSDRHRWAYHGVTHEYVTSDTAQYLEHLPQVSIVHYEDGGSRREKYERDISLLEKAVSDEPDNPRYAYYLAQSYRDTQRYAEAMTWYQKRAVMGGWDEEMWHAAYQVGKMQAMLHADWRVVLNTYLQAYNFRPSRLEPIYHIANFYREQSQFALGYHFARLVEEVPIPRDLLFIERDIYEFRLPLEYALCCRGTGRREAADRSFEKLMATPALPDTWRQQAVQLWG